MVLRGCLKQWEGSALLPRVSPQGEKKEQIGVGESLCGLKEGLGRFPHPHASPSQSSGPASGEERLPGRGQVPGVGPGTGRRCPCLCELQLTKASTAPSDLEINPRPGRHQHPHTRPFPPLPHMLIAPTLI